MKIGMSLGMRGQRGLTQIQRAIAFLRSLGTSAHVWLPGASGVSVASLPSNNYLLSDGSTGYSTVDAVVGLVKDAMDPVTGINLTQATTANKPLVRRGSYNYLLNSNGFSGASITPATGLVVMATGVADQNGALTARQIRNTVTTEQHRLFTSVSVAGVCTLSVYLKIVDAGFVQLSLAGTVISACCVNFNLSTGVVGTIRSSTASLPTGAIVSLGDGWYRCSLTTHSSETLISNVQLYVLESDPDAVNPTTTGTAKSVIVGGAQLEAGTTAGDYSVTTATAASNPSAGKYWWSFDGSNDSLLSGNLGITNACTIVIAGRVNSLAAIQYLMGEDTNGVQLYVNINGSLSFGKVAIADILISSAGQIVAGVPFVITVRLSGGTAVFRLNGVQIATGATAYTFSATTGARIGTSFNGISYPVGGAIGWVVPLPTALSDADCLTVERLVGSQFPGMASF